PIPLAFTGMVLGYLVGRQALAPVGLHEIALVLCSVGVYLAAGHLSGSGALFFALTSGVAVVAYHLIIFGLLLWQRGHAGFSSWATALLLPSALATAFVALLCHGPMVWLERRLTQDKREGLAWR
ncbi:MAG TPA: hypothetical protein VFH51_07385, partial [Myxococcota bacterium]|nr:hypothetical protein [Myxococcota bacterium]